MTDLVAKNANISDLTGLEFATNLTFLWLENNNITDISSVTGLTKLTRLDFGNNFIADISPVAGLDNLTSLWLWDNSISDISSVTGLTNLTKLGLWGNSISDISPLVANIGLGSGDTVYVQNNPLSYQSIHTHIPALQSRGVTVEFDNRAYPALLKIAGDNQHGASFVSLSQPFIVEGAGRERFRAYRDFGDVHCHCWWWHTQHTKHNDRCKRQGTEYAHIGS